MAEVKKDAAKKESPKKDIKKEANKPVAKKESAATERMDDVKSFLTGSKAELKKVHWPNRQQLVAYTGVVLVAVLIMSILVWVVDSGLSRLLQVLINLAK